MLGKYARERLLKKSVTDFPWQDHIYKSHIPVRHGFYQNRFAIYVHKQKFQRCTLFEQRQAKAQYKNLRWLLTKQVRRVGIVGSKLCRNYGNSQTTPAHLFADYVAAVRNMRKLAINQFMTYFVRVSLYIKKRSKIECRCNQSSH